MTIKPYTLMVCYDAKFNKLFIFFTDERGWFHWGHSRWNQYGLGAYGVGFSDYWLKTEGVVVLGEL